MALIFALIVFISSSFWRFSSFILLVNYSARFSIYAFFSSIFLSGWAWLCWHAWAFLSSTITQDITFQLIFIVLFVLFNPHLDLLKCNLFFFLWAGFFWQSLFAMAFFLLRLLFFSKNSMIPLILFFKTKCFFRAFIHDILTLFLQLFELLFSFFLFLLFFTPIYIDDYICLSFCRFLSLILFWIILSTNAPSFW